MASQHPSNPSRDRVRVITNAFVIKGLPTKPFYHYDIIKRENANGETRIVKPDAMRYREIMDRLFDAPDNASTFNPRPSYDGMKNMYSSKQITSGEFPVNMSNRPNAVTFRIVITLVNTIQPHDIQRLTAPDGDHSQRTQANTVAANLLQILITQAPNLQHNFAPHSKSFYIGKSRSRFAMTSGLEAWTGYFQSIRPVLGRLIVNVDTATAAVYKAESLLDNVMTHLRVRDQRALVEKCDDDRVWNELKQFYKSIFVTVPPMNRPRKVQKLVRRAGRQEFHTDQGLTTVAMYLEQKYNAQVRFPDALGVQIGKSAIYPAEMCHIVPGQVYKKRLSPEDTSAMVQASVARPQDKLRDIAEAVAGDRLNYAGSPWMQQAGLQVERQPLEIAARELAAPTVIYGSSDARLETGAWNVKGKVFYSPAVIKSWAVVVFSEASGGINRDLVSGFAQQLLENMMKLGMTFQTQVPNMSVGDSFNVWKSLSEVSRNGPTFVLVLMPAQAAEIRKQVKQWGDVMMGIPTQCLRGGKWDNPAKANDQYMNNVALKINARCGGINSAIDAPAVNYLKNALVVGCDVTHPSLGVKNKPSIAGVVTSIDSSATRYQSRVWTQEPRQESLTSDELIKTIKNGYVLFRGKDGQKPRHVLVFRDGVSEGEYKQVEENEIKPLEAAMAEADPPLSLIFVVVTKRHHVRFFPQSGDGDGRTGNCRPGLVVDSEIVHSTYPDFYLQSHPGLKGTSRPSHYIVLRNTPNLLADQWVHLPADANYQMRTTRAVSIPAPVYYADRLCTRAEYQFNPNSDLTLSETASNNTASDAFDLAAWSQALGQAKLNKTMYFI